jgi:hypothetical protein
MCNVCYNAQLLRIWAAAPCPLWRAKWLSAASASAAALHSAAAASLSALRPRREIPHAAARGGAWGRVVVGGPSQGVRVYANPTTIPSTGSAAWKSVCDGARSRMQGSEGQKRGSKRASRRHGAPQGADRLVPSPSATFVFWPCAIAEQLQQHDVRDVLATAQLKMGGGARAGA